jgi:copper chaperone
MQFEVEGMSCDHCVQAVTKAVRAIAPNAEVAIDLASRKVSVNGDDRRDAIATAIEDAGYKVLARA